VGRSDVQFALGLQSNWMIRYAGEWWRILTAVFCHGGLIHLLFNASFLVWLGKDLEETFTPSGAVIVFFGSGLMGGFVSYLAPVNTVGASGALFGYLGALLYYAKGRGGVYGERLFKQVGTWTIYCFVFGLLVGANNWGHAGGFVGGGLVAHLIGWDHSRLRRTRGLLAVLCLLLFVVCWGLTAWHFSENLALIRAS
jgi:rhomboid protease GluP